MTLPALAFSQNKKDNAIIIHENIPTEKINDILFSNGYIVSKSDSNFITTEAKEIKGVSIKFAISRKDSIMILKGWQKPLMSIQIYGVKSEYDFDVIYFAGMKGSILRNSWNEFDRMAKEISDKIEYTKQ